MSKGQAGTTLSALGITLMLLGVVFAVGLVILSTWQTTIAPNLDTSYNGSLKNTTVTTNKWQTEVVDLTPNEWGRWLNGSLEVTFLGQTNYTANVTMELNGVAIGAAYGYNASGSLTPIALTASQLGTGETVTFALNHNITMNITSYKLSGTYEKWTDTGSADLSGDVIDVFGDVVDWIPLAVIVLIIMLILALIGFAGAGRR